MSYHSDQGRMEREYYTPRDEPEREVEASVTVYCKYDQCAEFEIEHEVNLLIVCVGNSGTALYTCHRCELDCEFEFDLTDSDFGYDTDEDWRNDK
jgi:hypothetical protein